MVTVEILELVNSAENEPTISQEKTKEEIKVDAIEPSRVSPVNLRVARRIPMNELPDLIHEIKPVEDPKPDELDSYYAQRVQIYEDGDLSWKELDLPHHIGLRVVLESVLQKYGDSENLLIQIS